MYLIEKNRVLDIAVELRKDYDLFGPIIEPSTKQVFFDSIDEINEIRLSAPIPSNPPKLIFFPQMEKIISYKYDKVSKNVEIEPVFNERARALFGIRSCDLMGTQCLDRFFLGGEFVDEYYRNHRKKMFIVTNTCIKPFKQCLCVCTDSGPYAREGYDLNLTELGEYYLVEVGSEKGNALINRMSLKKAGKEHDNEKIKKINESIGLFDKIAVDSKAWISRVVNRVTTGLLEEEFWESIGKQCFECGACSFVCPSCSCFNIEDVRTDGSGHERFRCWDSCSYEGYSRMAGGHNPRKPIEDRRNKRFFCKLSYSQSKKYLRPGCVGCGRCAWVCPGDIGLPIVTESIRREFHKKADSYE